MKFHAMSAEQKSGSRSYIDSRWSGLASSVSSTKDAVLNYVFVLNSGGLLSALTYVATKTPNVDLYVAILCFAVGTLLVTLRAALDYYACEAYFKNYRALVNEFYEGRIDWQEVIDKDKGGGRFDWVFHVLGWSSGLLFVGGLVIGLHGIS